MRSTKPGQLSIVYMYGFSTDFDTAPSSTCSTYTSIDRYIRAHGAHSTGNSLRGKKCVGWHSWQKKRGFWNGMHLLLTLWWATPRPASCEHYPCTLLHKTRSLLRNSDRAVVYVALLTYFIDRNSFQARVHGLFAQHEIATHTFGSFFCLMRRGPGCFQV